jgi:hypothetical protein
MNGDTSDRRRWAGLRQAGGACVAVLALLAAACGGGGSPAPPASPPGSSATTAQALAYATCMRSHGIPDFPDPNVHGNAEFSLGVVLR